MTHGVETGHGRNGNGWRMLVWGGAVLLFLVPVVATQLTAEMKWDETDFIFAAVLIFGTALLFDLAARRTRHLAHRAAIAVALGTAFFLVWSNAAVGIIGAEDNPLNILYFGVLAAAASGAFVARLRPDGMARAMAAAAGAHVLIAGIALLDGYFTLPINAAFAALWLLSAWLFRQAARADGGNAAAP